MPVPTFPNSSSPSDLERVPPPSIDPATTTTIEPPSFSTVNRLLSDGPVSAQSQLTLVNEEVDGRIPSVTCVALAPHGRHLVTGSDDCYVRLWDARTGSRLQEWGEHRGMAQSITFSPDGSRIVSGYTDSIVVWDPARGQEALLRELSGHESDVRAVVYSPSGSKFASGSIDHSLIIWDATSYDILYTTLHDVPYTLRAHTHQSGVANLAWTPDERRIIACCGAVGRIWDADTFTLLHTTYGHTDVIWALSVSPAGDRFVTGSGDHTSRVWSTETGRELVTIRGHTGDVEAVAFSPDGSEVASGSFDRTVRTNDSFTGELRLCGRSHIIHSVAYSPDGKYLFAGAADGNVRMWDRESGEVLAEMRGHTDSTTHLLFSNDGKDLYSASDDGSIRVWSLRGIVPAL